MTKPENMTTKTFMTICAAAMLAACSGHCDRHHGCDGQCAPADSMNIVLDLHRHVKPQYVAAFKAAFIECKQQTVKDRDVWTTACIRPLTTALTSSYTRSGRTRPNWTSTDRPLT